jgi:hypothetical protein
MTDAKGATMSTTRDESTAETIFGIAAVTTAGGVLTFALFPLMLPGLVLLGILAAPLLPLVVVGAVVWAIVALARRVARLALRARSRSSSRTVRATSVKVRQPSRALRQPVRSR